MRLGPLATYGWGGDLRLPFGYWLVWYRASGEFRVYVSNDATPPDHIGTRGFFLVNR